MYMLSGYELNDTENISLPSQNMKLVGEWAKRTSHKLHILPSRLIFFSRTMGDCIVYTQYPATNVDECLSLCEDANEESSGACQAVSYFSSLHICSLEECTRHRPDPHDITTHFYVRECPDAGKTNAIDVFIFFDSTYGNSRLIINSIVSIFVFYILHIKLLLSVYVYTYYILHYRVSIHMDTQ
jgi:hypothetical protein